MRVDDAAHVIQGQAVDHSLGELAYHVGRSRAHHLSTQDLAGLLVRNDFYEAALLKGKHGLAVCRHGVFLRYHVDTLFLCFISADAD